MKIFKRRRYSISADSSSSQSSRDEERRYSLPNANHEILYFPYRNTEPNSMIIDNDDSSQTSIDESIALSESDTLLYDKRQQLELQETYIDNFTLYLPFVVRQMQHRDYQNEQTHMGDIGSDDQQTIIDGNDSNLNLVMNKELSTFNLKREFIVAHEFLKNNTYLFINQESFKLFKQLRKNKLKRKNLIIIYDENGTIKKLSVNSKEKPENMIIGKNEIIDHRSHMIPLDYKVKGLGLPVFRIHTPYLSSFRKNTPFLVFTKYREVPLKPIGSESSAGTSTENFENFESYSFCTVYVKNFYKLRRYILNFTPLDEKPFRIIVFQHNYKPFADFNYQNTRFRVIGTSLPCIYLTSYSPSLKLLIIDKNKPSLCDRIINKKPDFEILSLIKNKKKLSNIDTQDEGRLNNPYPALSNPLLSDEFMTIQSLSAAKKFFVSKLMPPFGNFKDSMMYEDQTTNLIPKKFSEVGRIELYQDNSNLNDHMNSTLSLDLESLVINCVMLTLRESNIRNTARTTIPPNIPLQES